MIDVLFVALVAVAIYNPTLTLWILVSMVVVSDALFGAVDGWVYFGLMALIDLLCDRITPHNWGVIIIQDPFPYECNRGLST
ncbi:hypothetical protein VchM-138_0067 [Vibrio phage vB_VchM-138]|uniref:hypothetical protein n=1 Tax=Vibrio phage vB_VchM-138 TaxID=1127518 RepID=UPI0002536E2F|nr:hypothetical protein F397_gp67 [Vibrio phage vB_VchM-138]AFC22746.1 hypothetical protein VchM-138_0067 [Vibrio phage vB_VchM-138]